jgi:hypothetical protein
MVKMIARQGIHTLSFYSYASRGPPLPTQANGPDIFGLSVAVEGFCRAAEGVSYLTPVVFVTGLTRTLVMLRSKLGRSKFILIFARFGILF